MSIPIACNRYTTKSVVRLNLYGNYIWYQIVPKATIPVRHICLLRTPLAAREVLVVTIWRCVLTFHYPRRKTYPTLSVGRSHYTRASVLMFCKSICKKIVGCFIPTFTTNLRKANDRQFKYSQTTYEYMPFVYSTCGWAANLGSFPHDSRTIYYCLTLRALLPINEVALRTDNIGCCRAILSLVAAMLSLVAKSTTYECTPFVYSTCGRAANLRDFSHHFRTTITSSPSEPYFQ